MRMRKCGMRKSLIIEALYEVSIVFRKESIINAKKVLNFIQSLTNEKKVIKSLTAFHTLESFWALKNFWVLKVPFIKENVEHSQAERLKTLSTNLRSRNLVVDIWQYKQHCSVIVEITDVKYGLFSKHLFQRTQHHGGFTKPLGNDKFV